MRNSMKVSIVIISIIVLTSQMMLVKGPIGTASEPTQQKTNIISDMGYSILFDEAHTALGSASMTPGNASFLAWILEEYGYNCEMNFNQTLDSGILSGIDALILVFPMVALTPAEVTAVHNFVEAGGDLLLIGTDDSPTWHFSPINLNAVSEIYGITFNMDNWLGTAKTMTAHHITQDVSSIHSNLDYKLRGCTLNVVSPATTVIEFQGNSVTAVSGAGTGKVVAVGSLAPFLQYRMNTQWQVEKDDLWQFSLNIFDWFAGITPRHVVVPDVAVITVGSGPNLSPAEIDNYHSFTGLIHDHTTHSDGQGTPMEMTWSGITRGLDFMVMTDHSYDAPNPSGLGGITGALACRDITESNGLDMEVFIGAELSHGQHSLAFPLTANIYASTQTEMVDGAHTQGAMIALCHPTISAEYMDAYSKWDILGYDAIEVDNSGYTHGLMDEGFTRPFYGASDGHSPDFVGNIVNIVFVNQTSVPNGHLADVDVVNAILNRRVVIRDFVTNLVYGQKVWVDQYLKLMQDAETEINDAKSAIEAVAVSQSSTLLSEQYLHDAEVAITYSNPGKAIRAAQNAESAEALNLSLEIVAPISRIYDPNTQYDVSLNVTNTYIDSVQFNMTLFRKLSLSSSMTSNLVVAPAGGQVFKNTSLLTGEQGYAALILNLKDFNTTSSLAPTLWGIGGLIYTENFTRVDEVGVSGTNVTGIFEINRGDFRYLPSAILFYNAGGGWQNISMSIKTVTLEVTIGPYLKGTVINWYGIVSDMFGNEFVLQGNPIMITTDPLQPTSTTTNIFTGLDPLQLLLLIAVGGTAVVIVLIVIMMKRKSSV
jgi:hypothetical protein